MPLPYDARDNRTSVVNGRLATTIAYDNSNRPTQRTDVIDGRSFVTMCGYDNRDILAIVTYPSGRVVTYSYECRGPGDVGWGAELHLRRRRQHDHGCVKENRSANGSVS